MVQSQQPIPSMYITTINYDMGHVNHVYAPMPGSPGFVEVGGSRGFGRINFEVEMDMTDGSRAILDRIMNNNGRFTFGVKREEWRCVYCGIANNMERTWCSQCGGPRGWIM